MYVCMCSTGTVCLWNVVRYRRSSSKLTYIHTFMSKDKKTRLYYYYFLFLKHVCVHTHRVVFCIEVYSLVGCHVGRSVSYVCTFVCVCVADLVSIVSCYDGNCVHMTCVLCGHT